MIGVACSIDKKRTFIEVESVSSPLFKVVLKAKLEDRIELDETFHDSPEGGLKHPFFMTEVLPDGTLGKRYLNLRNCRLIGTAGYTADLKLFSGLLGNLSAKYSNAFDVILPVSASNITSVNHYEIVFQGHPKQQIYVSENEELLAFEDYLAKSKSKFTFEFLEELRMDIDFMLSERKKKILSNLGYTPFRHPLEQLGDQIHRHVVYSLPENSFWNEKAGGEGKPSYDDELSMQNVFFPLCLKSDAYYRNSLKQTMLNARLASFASSLQRRTYVYDLSGNLIEPVQCALAEDVKR